MDKGRLEAFSDGVLAVIITIMVLEMRAPHGVSAATLLPLVPIFLTYLLSFVMIAIYWNNHHNMFHAVEQVTGGTLWANMHLLFWLSLIPFVTAWMDENHFAPVPVSAYSIVLLGCAMAYSILVRQLLASHAPDSILARAIGRDYKGILSLFAYVAAAPLAFVHPAISLALIVAVALVWLVPDRRFERLLAKPKPEP